MSEICRCSHPKEFHQSFLKEVPCDYDGKCVGGCQKFEPVGSDRHPKWQRVEPGAVIPAGQPTAVAFTDSKPGKTVWMENSGATHDITVYAGAEWFIDSSWTPPLELPTEPTWGIVVICDGPTWRERLGQWALVGNGKRLREQRYFNEWRTEWVKAFIPLTDEQVTRLIEATR